MKRTSKIVKSRAAARLKSKGSLLKGRSSRKKGRRVSRTKRVSPKTRSKLEARERYVPKVVRIMGHGQFRVDSKTLKKLKQLDSSLVEIVGKERIDDMEFRRRLVELSETAAKNGKVIDPKAIVRSDIILPSPDLGLEEAKRLFKGEGVIPAT